MPINKFTTLLDLSRQAKILTGETATFDGKISSGIPFSGYPTGVDTATTVSLGVISTQTAVFSGGTGTTVFDVSNIYSPYYNPSFDAFSADTWSNPLFSANTSGLTLPITILLTGPDVQIVGPFWTLTQTGYTGEYIIGTQYTGYSVTYSFNSVTTISSTDTISGFTTASQEIFSAGTLDYKGPLDYLYTSEDATIKGRLTTNKLTIENGASSATTNYLLTQVDDSGKAGWASPSSLLSGITTLDYVLTNGNTTGSNWIVVDSGYGLNSQSSSFYSQVGVSPTIINIYTGDDFATASKWSRISAESFTPTPRADITTNDGVSQTNLGVTKDNILVQGDDPGFSGIEYFADYSTNYTNRSLVDKEYVDLNSGSDFTGGTVTGTTTFTNGLSANTISATTIGSSGDCVDDIYVSNIHSCSPLNINPLDEGNIYFGSSSGITIDLTNKRVGIGTNNPQYPLEISGATNERFYFSPSSIAPTISLVSDVTNQLTQFVIGQTVSSIGVSMGVRGSTEPTFSTYGKQGDSFIRAGDFSNGLNIIEGPNGTKENYIRFYAGQTADPSNIPDIHIQGSGTTRGYIGVRTYSPEYLIDVNGNSTRLLLVDTYTGADAPFKGFVFSGNSNNVPQIVVSTSNISGGNGLGLQMGVLGNNITPTSSTQLLGTLGDTYLSSNAQTNNFNILNRNGGSGTNHIRMYAGVNSVTAAPNSDFHIQGDGVTRGYIGINTDTPIERIHVVSTLSSKIRLDADINNTDETATAEILLTQDGYGSTANIGISADVNNDLLIGVNSGGGTTPDIRFNTRSDGTVFTTSADTKMILKNDGKLGINTENPSEILDVSGKTKTIEFQMTSGATAGYVLTSDASGNASWQSVSGGTGGVPEATTATTTTINFTGQTIYYNATTPGTGNISQNLTGAKLGLIQKIYHNDVAEPTYPAGWVLIGDTIYFTSTLNIIYAEWATGSRVEYWYVQEQ